MLQRRRRSRERSRGLQFFSTRLNIEAGTSGEERREATLQCRQTRGEVEKRKQQQQPLQYDSAEAEAAAFYFHVRWNFLLCLERLFQKMSIVAERRAHCGKTLLRCHYWEALTLRRQDKKGNLFHQRFSMSWDRQWLCLGSINDFFFMRSYINGFQHQFNDKIDKSSFIDDSCQESTSLVK